MRFSNVGPKITILVLSIQLLSFSCQTKNTRPNILIIQMDDLGFDDLAHHGNQFVETPSIDQLASSSAEFSHFYVNPVCAPTRAALLTGRHYLRTGVSHVHGGRDFINLNETLMSELFQANGYKTGMWGKWHSGKTQGYFPWDRGFDEAYMAQLYKHANSRGHLNGELVEHNKWAEEVIVDYAIDFISTSNGQPFFAYLSFLTCHRPLVAPESIIDKYHNKGLPKPLATLYAMIDHADQQVGRLMHFTKESGIDQNTIVLFMSDNGPDYDAFQSDTIRAIRNINNLRGYKGDIWENGVRSPLLIKWGSKIETGLIRSTVDVTDILPTLLEICDIVLPDDHLPLDGESFAAALSGQKDYERGLPIVNFAHHSWPPANKHEVFLDDQYDPIQPEEKAALLLEDQVISILSPPYKLLINPNNPVDSTSIFLTALDTDPSESNNLAVSSSEKVFDLKSELQEWWQELLGDSHSFASPVFLIGTEVKSVVPLMAPSFKTQNLRTSYRGINHWEPSASATYQLDIRAPGAYTMELIHQEISLEPIEVELTLQGQKLVKKISTGVGTDLGKIHLKGGRCLLQCTLIHGQPDDQFKLFEINFIKH